MASSVAPVFRTGTGYVLAASALWALGYFVRKLVLADVPAIWLSFFTTVLAAVMLALQYRLKPRDAIAAFRRRPGVYVALSLFGTVIGTTLMYRGLETVDLGVATALEKLQPVFTVLFAGALLGERLTRRELVLGALAVGASSVLALGGFRKTLGLAYDLGGLLALVGAAAAWGLSAVVGKLAMNASDAPELVSMIRFSLAAIMMTPVIVFRAGSFPWSVTCWDVLMIVGAAYFSTVLGYVLYYRGLKDLSAGASGFLELVTPVLALLLGVCFLKESVAAIQALAISILFLSVLMLAARK